MAEPKLRFKDENGKNYPEWKTSKMESLGCFDKGRLLSKADISETGIPMILYGELYTHYKEVAYEIQRKTEHDTDGLYISKGGEVILPCSGETPEDISTATCVMKQGVALGGDLIVFTPYEIDGRIMSYILNHPQKYKIASVAQGKSVVHISASSIKKLDMTYPVSNEEQQKIAELFSSVDEVIVTLTEEVRLWEEKKKGVMQKIFSQEVRFKDENGEDYPEWDYKKIGDTLEYEQPTKYIVKNADYNGSLYPVLTANKAFILGYTDEEIGVYNRGEVIIFDDFTCDSKYVDFGFKVKSSAIKLLTQKDKSTSLRFMYEYLKSINQKPLGHQRHWISVFQEMYIPIPCLAEQQKIADCLSSIDEVIAIKKQKLETWKNIKKGLLQQMFV